MLSLLDEFSHEEKNCGTGCACQGHSQRQVAADNMKLSLWRAMQGIKDEQLLVSVLSRVVAKELGLEEMVIEFNK